MSNLTTQTARTSSEIHAKLPFIKFRILNLLETSYRFKPNIIRKNTVFEVINLPQTLLNLSAKVFVKCSIVHLTIKMQRKFAHTMQMITVQLD